MKIRRIQNSKFSAVLSAAIALVISTACLPRALADESNGALKAGMTAFNAGNYSEAAGHFGLALTTEFNNSVLHYYLGNCFVRMKQREAAIREFRIAYALDPEKDVGKYAKQALAGLGADSPNGAAATAPTTPAVHPKDADAMAKNAVNKLMDWKSKTPVIEISRGGRLIEQNPPPVLPPKPGQPNPLTPPVPSPLPPLTGNYRLDGLRKLYEANHATAQSNFELQRAAENLHELMNKQAKPGEHHVVPIGTNLYIRNYQTEGEKLEAKPPQAKSSK